MHPHPAVLFKKWMVFCERIELFQTHIRVVGNLDSLRFQLFEAVTEVPTVVSAADTALNSGLENQPFGSGPAQAVVGDEVLIASAEADILGLDRSIENWV